MFSHELQVEIVPNGKENEILYEAVVQAPFLTTSDGRTITGEQIIATFTPKLIKTINGKHWISMQRLANHLNEVLQISPDIQKYQKYPYPKKIASIAIHAYETAGIMTRIHSGYDRDNQRWLVNYRGQLRYPQKKSLI